MTKEELDNTYWDKIAEGMVLTSTPIVAHPERKLFEQWKVEVAQPLVSYWASYSPSLREFIEWNNEGYIRRTKVK
jgi:hypothetical protein